jgi:hypothetical protein
LVSGSGLKEVQGGIQKDWRAFLRVCDDGDA